MRKIILLLLLASVLAYPLPAQDIPEKLDELVTAYAQQGRFSGAVLVARQGQVLLDKGYGYSNRETQRPNDGNTIFRIASATKPFTATLVLKLVELQKLAITDPLSKYYPGYPHGDSITLEHLLTHTSGIYDYTGNRRFMDTGITKPATEQQILALFRDQPLDFAPGANWRYSNSNYMLLGYIIQQVTGLTYEAALKQYIFTPLHMQHSGYAFTALDAPEKATGYRVDNEKEYTKAAVIHESVPFAAGAVYSTTRDLYKWHQGLQRNAIVSAALMEQAYRPFRPGYGYGWQTDSKYGRRQVFHTGSIHGFRSNVARIPEDDVCVILLSNIETPIIESMTAKLLAILYGQPYYLPGSKKMIQLDRSFLKKYTGAYQLTDPQLLVEIKLENGALVAYPERNPSSVLRATDDTHFSLQEDEEFELIFQTNGNGQVESLTVSNNGRSRTAKKIR